MPRFPKSEAEISKLAELVADGLEQAPDDFPVPPVSGTVLREKVEQLSDVRAEVVAAETTFREKHALKDEILEDVADSTKAILKYAEYAVGDRPEKLNQLGWAPRRSGTALEAPGEVGNMKVAGEGDDWVVLRWESPDEGDKPAFYKIQRKTEGESWADVATATETEHLMSGQPRGIEIDYRVIAVNKAGEGSPSATVTVVL